MAERGMRLKLGAFVAGSLAVPACISLIVWLNGATAG